MQTAVADAANQRATPDTDEDRRYVNVASGTEAEMEAVAEWWQSRGITVEISPGPALMTSVKGTRGPLGVPLPITPESVAKELKVKMTAAHSQLVAGGENTEDLASLPIGLDQEPKWNSHSCRRGGTKRARDLLDVSKAKEEDVNRHFGWQEEALKGGKRRQVAYAGTLPAARRKNVTRMF